MMRLPKMDHVAPETVPEASSILNENGENARIIAGGTDVLVACKLRNIRPVLLVGLARIPALRGIQFRDGEGLRIGAMTSLNEVRHDPVIQEHYPALALAAASVGAHQLQYMGTLGGNLCLNTRCIYYNQSDSWRKSRSVCIKMGGDRCHVVPKGKRCFAVSSGDTAPALMAYDATVKLVGSEGERTIPLEDFYTGDGSTPLAIKNGEILTAIMLPPPGEGESSIYLKYRVRGAIDFPLAGVAARVISGGNGQCRDCRIAINAVGPSPITVSKASDLLRGKPLTVEAIEEAAEQASASAHPLENVAGASPSYRRKMIGILTRRALKTLSQGNYSGR